MRMQNHVYYVFNFRRTDCYSTRAGDKRVKDRSRIVVYYLEFSTERQLRTITFIKVKEYGAEKSFVSFKFLLFFQLVMYR